MSDTLIQLNDLPLRPKKLSDAELEGVFGGCKSKGRICKADKDCCDGRKCITSNLTAWGRTSGARHRQDLSWKACGEKITGTVVT